MSSTPFDRAVAAQDAGNAVEAMRLYREAIEFDPRNAAARFNLGLLLLDEGRADAAEAEFREAARLRDPFPEAWVALGDALEVQGKDIEALLALEHAISQRDGYEGALLNAAALLKKLGRPEDAEPMYRRAIAVSQATAGALNDLGTVLLLLGRREEAEGCFRQVVQHEPAVAIGYSNLANALRELGRNAEAEASARDALRLDATLPEAHFNLGNALQAQGRATDSVASLQRAIELRPAYGAAHNSLGNSLKDFGRLEEAEASFLRALALDANDRDARSNYLLLLNYTASHSREKLHSEHLDWARRHELPSIGARKKHANSREPGRRLRIGYLSGDFRRHSVAYFIEPVLALHDREAFEVHCYSNVASPDQVTSRLLGHADHAHSIFGVADGRVAEKIRHDGIDLLVDLSGHTAGNRLPVFALKPAPVQATYLGYPNTTGLQAIDWRITDVHADPPGDGDEFHSERLLRLPGAFLSFQPPSGAPEVRPPPSVAGGHVTFGSFNVLPKVTREVIRVWSRILDQLPGSRLLLKAHGLGDAGSRAAVLAAFQSHGLSSERIHVLPQDASFQAHLARYHEVDIALDPFPYNGTTTTLEALWMGVPVIALTGDRHSARVGASLLANVGLQELVAHDRPGYEALATALAKDPVKRAGLRRSMRERIAHSPLLDRAGFMRALEAGYREMWKAWCRLR